jgi:transposase-like protein
MKKSRLEDLIPTRELVSGLDEVILSLYARGQSIKDVRYQLGQLYGIEVSTGTITAVTERDWSEVLSWQQRALPSCSFFVDGLAVFKEVIEEVYPQSIVQRYIVHMVHTSVKFVGDKDM